MKKIIGILGVGGILLIGFYLLGSSDNKKIDKPEPLEANTKIVIGNTVSPVQNSTLVIQKVKELKIAKAQCKHKKANFLADVSDIHQELIQALENELKQGKTVRELLAYSNQYKTFYKNYNDLLLLAKINIEKPKYNYTKSSEILLKWDGLSVINGFSPESIPTIVEQLKEVEGTLSGFVMTLPLAKNINKSDVYALLDNDQFNTYLESAIGTEHSPVISPSILFALTANHLELDEFKQAIAFNSFNVNDVAIAILNDMPIEYISALIAKTEAINDMPIIALGNSDSFDNLADLAASKHNLGLLKLLEKHGVKGTNEESIITAMDIAIMNLPSDAKAYQDLDNFPQKYLNTITYLHNKGYAAHGESFQNNNSTEVFFKAPIRRNFQTTSVLEPKLKAQLNKIELIEKKHINPWGIRQKPVDGSLLSKVIKNVNIKVQAKNDKSDRCASIKEDLLAAEGFAKNQEAYDIINDIKKLNVDIAPNLHEIDPSLVNLWHRRNLPYTASNESEFLGLITQDKYQRALEYSMTKPLTIKETDWLLQSIFNNVDNVLPIWRARTSPTPPSNLLFFKKAKFDHWQALMDAGFDFTIKDQLGNDIFLPAVLHSAEVVKLLLDKGYSPEFDSLGLDALDLLLEDSYQTGKLNPSFDLIIQENKKIEPSHYARVERIKQYLPDEYKKIIALNSGMIPKEGTEINRFRLNRY